MYKDDGVSLNSDIIYDVLGSFTVKNNPTYIGTSW